MGSNEYAWNSRLAVRFLPNGSDEKGDLISPITNFSPTLDLTKEIIDSIDGANLGYSTGNPRFSFDFEIQAVNMQIFRKIFATAVKGRRFSVVIAEMDGVNNNDWVFSSLQFDDCVITSVDPSSMDNGGGVPTMKFSAICLSITADGDNGSITTNKTIGATDQNFTPSV